MALCIAALFIVVARGHLCFHRTVRDRTALDGTAAQFDVYRACICANYRLKDVVTPYTHISEASRYILYTIILTFDGICTLS